MNKVFNFIEDKAINVPLTENRGFLYGDGFFETIIIKDNSPSFFEDHYKRMVNAASALQLSPLPTFEQLKKKVNSFSPKTPLKSRLKLIVFRNSGGLFAPCNNTPLFYFDYKNIIEQKKINKSAFFSSSTSNKKTSTSHFKTLSSLNYILAGLELNKSTKDEIILLDEQKNVSECLSSNIWWIKDNSVFTPSLNTGCVEGVAKTNILNHLKKQNIAVKVGEFKTSDLLNADFCFTSNVAGLHIIDTIEDIKLQQKNSIFTSIKKALFQ